MALSPAGLGTKNDCVGEDQQQFTRPIYRRIIISASGWKAKIRFPVEARDFSVFHSVQAGSGAPPDSSIMGTEGSSPGGKAAGS
jgi:hypothetical protein